MYKIYINTTPLYLGAISDAANFGPPDERHLLLRYTGKRKFLNNVIDQLEKTDRLAQVAVLYHDLPALWADFQAIYKGISAAGGLVFNGKGEVLMIFRRGSWDLPKGKIDKGETPEAAAVREVQEETGLAQLSLGPHLLDTWHTYEMNGKRVLKTTHWYRMATNETNLVPQQEEDIEQAVWVSLADFLATPKNVYGNILDVLRLG